MHHAVRGFENVTIETELKKKSNNLRDIYAEEDQIEEFGRADMNGDWESDGPDINSDADENDLG